MGDGEKTPLKLNFDSKVRLEYGIQCFHKRTMLG